MIAVATALTFAWTSCEKPAPEEPGPDTPGNTDTPGEGENQDGAVAEITAVLENTTVKTVWAEGDVILVYAVTDGGDIPSKYILSAGAGTAEGKFVPSGNAAAADATAYFATYPYNEDLSFAMHNTFSFALESEQATDVPVFAYAENAANLTFSSPVGAVKFPLKGKGGIAKIEVTDADSKAILNGNATYNPKTTKFDIKNAAASKNVVTKVLAEKVELGDTPVDFVVELPKQTLAAGGTLILYDVNNSPLANVEIPAQTIEAGKVAVVEIAPIVPVAQTVNLNSVQGYANTYQIKAVGKYKFETVKGNDNSAKVDAVTAEITWETWCNNEPVTPNSLVKSVTVEDGFVVIETADDYHAGNALVSVKDGSGTIVWSWMLWFTEETISNVEVDGVVYMDRNLGALTTDKTKPGLNYGLLWQWGRSVPIMGLDGTHNSDAPTAMTCTPAIPENERVRYDDEGVGLESGAGFAIDYVIANPCHFYYSGNRTWHTCPMDEAGSRLWGSTKTIYDPCPAGYQVISYDNAQTVFAGIDESVENDPVNFGFTLNGQWYPYTGRWKYSGSSRLTDATIAYFWTSEQKWRDDDNGYNVAQHFQVEAGSGKGSYESMGSAMTVRCELIQAE